jgi:hypothetical protein
MVRVVKDAEGRPGIAEAEEVFLLPELERVADFYAERKDASKAAARPTLGLTRGILARPQREWRCPLCTFFHQKIARNGAHLAAFRGTVGERLEQSTSGLA